MPPLAAKRSQFFRFLRPLERGSSVACSLSGSLEFAGTTDTSRHVLPLLPTKWLLVVGKQKEFCLISMIFMITVINKIYERYRDRTKYFYVRFHALILLTFFLFGWLWSNFQSILEDPRQSIWICQNHVR